jgi:hypothetical protein
MTNREARWWWLAAAVALITWVVTAFVLALETGWVHVLLVAGVLATVRGIVESDRADADKADKATARDRP